MESLLPLMTFAFASMITPGPNNLMLAASGVAFGWRRTLPHMLGIPAGLMGLLIVSGLGVGALVTNVPAAGLALKVFGTLYLIYLAWVMRHSLSSGRTVEAARPLKFVEAAVFQFANPKAWIVALTAVSIFIPDAVDPRLGLVAVCGVFLLMNVPCILAWVALGVTARKAFVGSRWRHVFAAVIVGLMLYTIVGIWV